MKHPSFIMLPYAVYDSAAFTTLLPIDIAVLLVLIRKHNGRNNGDIPLGVREAAKRCKCGQMTALRSLKRLQIAGLIGLVKKGHMVPEMGRPDVASRWRLNFVSNEEIAKWTNSNSPSLAEVADGPQIVSATQTPLPSPSGSAKYSKAPAKSGPTHQPQNTKRFGTG